MGGPLDTETIVEFSCYLLEIQLHDPTVKVLPAPIINHHKQSIGIALHTITAPLMLVESINFLCHCIYIVSICGKCFYFYLFIFCLILPNMIPKDMMSDGKIHLRI